MIKRVKILIASHDAGASNILASLVKKYQKTFNWKIFSAGPGELIFKKEKIKAVNFKFFAISKFLSSWKPNLVITGTGWGTDQEKIFRKEAKKLGIKTACFLDHWSYYRQRFGYPGKWKENLPDFIFVGDQWATRIALKLGFPRKKVIQVENPYFEKLIEKAKQKKANRQKTKLNLKIILYVSEPLSQASISDHGNSRYWGYNEYDVIKDLLKVTKVLLQNEDLILIIRLHPSDKKTKFNSLIKQKRFKAISEHIRISDPQKSSLLDDLLPSDVVVGSTSLPLFIALMLSKKVISYIPSSQKVFTLPQKEIKKIASIEKLITTISAPGPENQVNLTKYLTANISFGDFINQHFPL